MTNIYFESVLMAWQSIVASKMRSLLTMLGIIIGVSAVIVLVSLGYGVRSDIEKNISSLGSNLVTVRPGTSRTPGVRSAAGGGESLTYKDYEAIRRLPNIAAASPSVSSSYIAVNGNKNWTTTVTGAEESYFSVRDLALSEGRLWTEEEERKGARVAIIGKTVAEGLFGEESPVGRKIRINNDPFLVIGLLETKGYSFGDQDDRIIAPFNTVQGRMMGITYVQSVELTATDSAVIDQVEADITNLLRTRHRLRTGEENDFSIQNSQEILQTMEETTQALTLFLGSIAAISLVVGGIGIMNIMLVSVTERTREIGIRKALGATYSMIITQFLIEAVTISIAGGLIGIVLGIAISALLPLAAGISTQVTAMPIIGSFLFSVMIGLIFGLYPARKAARLNPIDALHYE